MKLKTEFCSSLAKIMPGEAPETETKRGCALRGERFSFQMAYRIEDEWRGMMDLKVESSFGRRLRVRKVELVPVEYTGVSFDEDIISRNPGMYPDRLSEFTPEENWAPAMPYWRAVWFTVDIPEDWEPGEYKIKVTPRCFWPFDRGEIQYTEFAAKTFTLEVLDAVLPPQKLINTHWFYADCLASYYNVPVFSEEHWRIIENFMKSAADHGINMILTPVFTPPLDTLPGTERPTVQLVDVACTRGKYSFNLTKLERWIRLAKKCGMKYFEISHLFTQWGAEFTPKIIADVDGKEKRIFGWDVKANSRKYRDFLDAFLPVLTDFLKKKKLQDTTYFHCSDEPSFQHLKSYRSARSMLNRHLGGFHIMDALSSVDFYKEGIVAIPVPGETHLEDFLAAGVKDRWTYYCCGPTVTYSNRFIHMPSARNRIFGTLLYVHDIIGFLHWGFNFYYSGLSRHQIDPFRTNDSGYFFPDGDGFLLYPGRDGQPEDSIRYEVFYEALQDQRVLEKLESYIGREKIQKELDKLSPTGKMKIDEFPKGEKAVMAVRNKINQLLRRAIRG